MRRLMVKCNKCGSLFDSMFTDNDIEKLPRDQLDVGTFHLCPYCGYLGVYHLKNYLVEGRGDS